MTTAVRARGVLVLEDAAAVERWLQGLDSEDVEEELAEAIREGIEQEGASLIVDIDTTLTNAGNLEFQEWIEDLAEDAQEGHLDTWQEPFGTSMYVRIHAGGGEDEIPGPMPA